MMLLYVVWLNFVHESFRNRGIKIGAGQRCPQAVVDFRRSLSEVACQEADDEDEHQQDDG